MLRSFFACADVEGQGLIEYGLLLVLMAVAIVGALTFVGLQISENLYDPIKSGIDGT